jgi:hypothetical protein
MKVIGLNKSYSVEIKEFGDEIAITVGNVFGSRMSVMISKEDWEKLKEMKE